MPQFEYPHNETTIEHEDDEQIARIEDILDRMSEQEIDSGVMGGNTRYHVKVGRSQKDVAIEGGKAVFEVPVVLSMQNEDRYEVDDPMYIVCQFDLADESLSFVETRDMDGAEYEGDLEDWYDDAVLFVRSNFDGTPKTREDLEMDRYLRS